MDEWIATIAGSMRAQLLGTFLAPGSTFSIAALAVSLVVFVLLMVGRRRRPVRFAVLRRALFPRRLLGSASGRCDLTFFVVGLLFAGLAIGWAVVSADRVRAGLGVLLGPSPTTGIPRYVSAPVVTAALFLAYEFAYWFDHWLKHRVAFLWRFHKVHHQAESLSLLTNGRVHPVDTIIFHNIVGVTMGVTGAALAYVFGPAATPLTLNGANVLIMASAVVLTHLQHSHLWWTLGPRWGRWLLGSAHHQIHHSADPAHFNRNLGSSVAVFDRMFGTFHFVAERPADLRFGVDDDERAPHGVRAALVRPFADAARDLAQGAARAVEIATDRSGRRRRKRTPSAA